MPMILLFDPYLLNISNDFHYDSIKCSSQCDYVPNLLLSYPNSRTKSRFKVTLSTLELPVGSISLERFKRHLHLSLSETVCRTYISVAQTQGQGH